MSPPESSLRRPKILVAPILFAVLLLCCWSLLCAAEWHAGLGFRSSQLSVSRSGRAGFELLPSTTTAILFSNTLPESISITNQILLDGSGVAAGDIDGDGWCDLYFCAIDGRNTLYRNLGNWKFEDITDRAGVGCAGLRSTGAAFADLDGDGKLDLIVNTAGNGTRVFFNEGQGRFRPGATILNPNRGGKSLALADVDGDGYLDLYVVNYRRTAFMDEPNGARFTFKMVDGKQTVDTFNGRPVAGSELADRFAIGPQGDFQENGEPDVLYRNFGGTNFVAIPFTGGSFLDEDGLPLSKAPLDWGLSAMFRDINGDGLPDLYVCNDFQTPDRFWINQGGGKFRLLPRLAQRKSSISSMAVDFADINRDGYDDFFTADMMSRDHAQRMRVPAMRYPPKPGPSGNFEDRPQYEMNSLFLNRGDGTFAEIAQLCGVEASEWTWACAFVDVDLDGWEDLLVANGVERDGRDFDVTARLKQLRSGRQPSAAEILQVRRSFPRQANGNVAFRNRGDLTFEEMSKAWGFDWKGVSTGMAFADLDNDGDLDVVVNTLNGPALIYRNESIAPRVAVRLKGRAPNTRGVGARIVVSGGAVPLQAQEMICGGRYLSCDDTLRVFATGPATRLSIAVTWRAGNHSILTNALPGYLYEVDENNTEELPAGIARTTPGSAGKPPYEAPGPFPLFEDVSQTLHAMHHDDPFDDFERQPLLPNKLSASGPGVAWLDVDGDGRDDLVIGAGHGGHMGVYLNRGPEGFIRREPPTHAQTFMRSETGIVGWHPTTNQVRILAGYANYEDGQATGPAVLQYDLSQKSIDDSLPAFASSTGPLALADLMGTGDLELFVGGRVIPGRYPEPASSQLFRRQGDKWELDEENTRLLDKIGLVSGAVFSDLDGDGLPELILACEWGPVRIFRNQGGKFSEWDVPLTWVVGPGDRSSPPHRLSQLTGWWNAITAGDFDGDGRLDLIAANWGRNTKYQPLRSGPLLLYYGDLAEDGTMQIVEAHYEPPLQKIVPLRQLDDLSKTLPFLRGRFSSHQRYGSASVQEVLGDRFSAAKKLEAVCLESIELLNRGDHFEVRPLPIEAQMSPAFGVCIGDFDGDGTEDLFLAQNFFAAQPETPRYDAGRGLLLKNDGSGAFQAVPGQESGIRVYGEQRGAAVGDFDGDGRLDLVVTQNGAETKLYRNVRGRPGLRVRLRGPSHNPDAFGALIRLKSGQRWGPARELHGGSGYWSQDTLVQVMSADDVPREILVRWPGGKTTTNTVPSEAREIQVGFDGALEVLR